MKRRYKKLTLSLEVFLDMLRSGKRTYKVVSDAIPEDARIVRIVTRQKSKTVILVIESQTFYEAPSENLADLPNISPVIKRYYEN